MSEWRLNIKVYDDTLNYVSSYEGLGGNYTLGANMAAGAFAGIAVSCKASLSHLDRAQLT